MRESSLDTKSFLNEIEKIVQKKNLITHEKKAASYYKGFRFGGGKALAVILPDSLIQLWQVARTCVDADVIMINYTSREYRLNWRLYSLWRV